jgi:uncharacterized protein YyaL (SSP411 family)
MSWALLPATHLVIVEGDGAEAARTAEAMHRAALRHFAPRRVVQRVRAGQIQPGTLPPAVAGMLAAATGTRGYACVGTSCQAPAATGDAWLAALAAIAAA